MYGCASDRQQAAIVFDVAADMVRMCPALSKRVKILASQKRIIYLPTNSFYQVLSSEAYSKHGFNIHGVVYDELHAAPDRRLFDVMTKGSGDARMQPLFFYITTAGTDTNSICYETHQKAKDILEGRKIDPTFYPVIYGADEGDDWTDPKVWKKANPSLDITVGMDKVKAACESAKQNPGEENSFRQLRLNQWVKQAVRWMPMEKWDQCAFAVNEEELEGRVCYAAWIFPPPRTSRRLSWCSRPWMRKISSSCSRISGFRKRRWICGCAGIMSPMMCGSSRVSCRPRREMWCITAIMRNLLSAWGTVQHPEIAFDRWGAVQMVQNLEGMGFTVVPFGQGFKDMSPPTKELMKLTLEQRIAHGGHPVLRWMMDNIFIRTDPAGTSRRIRRSPRRRSMERSRRSWGLTGRSGAGMIQGNLFTIPGAFCLYKRVLPGQDSLQIYRVIFSASNHP